MEREAVTAEEIAHSDLVIGLPTCASVETIGHVVDAVRTAVDSSQVSATVVIRSDASGPAPLESHNGLKLLPYPIPAVGGLPGATEGWSDAYRAIFAVSKKTGARATAMLGADLEGFTAERTERLLRPVDDNGADLVVASYAHNKYEGMITSGILYPLTSTLYGKRVRWPYAADFGLSARMIDRLSSPPPPALAASRRDTLIWMVLDAIRGDFDVCQTHFGARVRAVREPTDLSSMLAHVLGPIFLDMEFNAAQWQRVHSSLPVTTFGHPAALVEEPHTVDVRPLIEAFQLGFQNLQPVWSLVLPPATLLDLKKLTLAPPEHFRIKDALWARIIYDFALGHRLRILNRDHLLRALTPLYRAWVASYALEVENADTEQAERRVEQLRLAYESERRYLLSRWRWPDRFSP
ncbi:MAG TPA: hypothetical protein VKU01_14640 [Bryobacteraceae bacterium]|nr:hypothetical protein [Bryobacteraceae bacterium]